MAPHHGCPKALRSPSIGSPCGRISEPPSSIVAASSSESQNYDVDADRHTSTYARHTWQPRWSSSRLKYKPDQSRCRPARAMWRLGGVLLLGELAKACPSPTSPTLTQSSCAHSGCVSCSLFCASSPRPDPAAESRKQQRHRSWPRRTCPTGKPSVLLVHIATRRRRRCPTRFPLAGGELACKSSTSSPTW